MKQPLTSHCWLSTVFEILTSTFSGQATRRSSDVNQNTSITTWELANIVNHVSYGKPAFVADHYRRVSGDHRSSCMSLPRPATAETSFLVP